LRDSIVFFLKLLKENNFFAIKKFILGALFG